MTSRQFRRAEERQARKQAVRAHKTEAQTLASATPLAPLAPNGSQEQAPPDLAGMGALLSTGDARLYQSQVAQLFRHFNPAPGIESVLVRRLADTQWRIDRTAKLEAGILKLGRLRYAELYPEADATLRDTLLDAHTWATDGVALKRLHTQEAHLRRYYRHDLAELAALQQQRLAEPVAHHTKPPLESPQTAAPTSHGFEFSNQTASDDPPCNLEGPPTSLPGYALPIPATAATASY